MSKHEMRAQLAALSFTEKIKILERLRDRSLALAASGLRREPAGDLGKTGDGNERFCACKDWAPCGCGHQPPYHCMWCCLELSPDQVAAARRRGWYQKEEE